MANSVIDTRCKQSVTYYRLAARDAQARTAGLGHSLTGRRSFVSLLYDTETLEAFKSLRPRYWRHASNKDCKNSRFTG